jgi:type IV pilus secretin PilQ/predicted competence protein
MLAVFSLLAGEMLAPAGVWAQRRRAAEPEASPDFQEQLRSSRKGGSPIAEPDEEESPEEAPARASAQASAKEDDSSSPLPVRQAAREVQIGASSVRKAAPAAPTDPLETRIVVRVKAAPLATFLDTISAQAKVNFIITEGLEEKRITAFLQNVTVREALQILLEIKGLTYQRIGKSNTYVVSPRAKGVPNRITRIYTMNFVPLMPTDGAVKDFSPKSSNNQAQIAAAGAGNKSPAESGGSESSAATATILQVLRSVMTKDYGNVAVDSRTNSLIITDIPEVFPQVEQILAELDKKAPQVIIEAQIVEIDSDKAQNLGLEWGASDGTLATYTGPARDTSFPMNLPKNLNNAHFFDPVTNVVGRVSNSGTSGAASTVLFGNGLLTGIVDLTQLKVVLRALVARTEARFLGKPKILTLNNKQALIQISQDQAVSVQQTTTGLSSGVSQSGATIERYQTGLTLRVTPQINRDGYISMIVEPSFTDVIASKLSSSGVPIFDPTTRAATTMVRVKNGQTLVLGGLLESRETKVVRKVPLLGYIPLIGWLFTSTQNQRTNTDLVIFITPTIVND